MITRSRLVAASVTLVLVGLMPAIAFGQSLGLPQTTSLTTLEYQLLGPNRSEPFRLTLQAQPLSCSTPLCICCETCYDMYMEDRGYCNEHFPYQSPAWTACIQDALTSYYQCKNYCESTYGGSCLL